MVSPLLQFLLHHTEFCLQNTYLQDIRGTRTAIYTWDCRTTWSDTFLHSGTAALSHQPRGCANFQPEIPRLVRSQKAARHRSFSFVQKLRRRAARHFLVVAKANLRRELYHSDRRYNANGHALNETEHTKFVLDYILYIISNLSRRTCAEGSKHQNTQR